MSTEDEMNFNKLENAVSQLSAGIALNADKVAVEEDVINRILAPPSFSQMMRNIRLQESHNILVPFPKSFLTHNAIHFLEMNRSLEPSLSKVISEMLSFLDNESILYKLFVDVVRDIEATEWEALKIHVNIENRDFSEILKIWDNVCREVYRELDRRTAKKFYIIMRKA